MKSDHSRKMLAFLVFISSSVSAFCLGILAFTLTTGELPFGITPILTYELIEVDTDTEETPDLNDKFGSEAEAYAMDLFNKLQYAREEFAAEKEALAERERFVEALAANADKLQGKLET